MPGLDPVPRSALQRLTARLDGVRLLPAGAPEPRWAPDRRNARYAHALVLAELVLRGASCELGDGREIAVDGMLVTMWRLFAVLSPAGGPMERYAHLVAQGRIKLRPVTAADRHDMPHYEVAEDADPLALLPAEREEDER
ncbi:MULTISPECIES: hypothetical protein [unclassified Streptomyces]|uniref:hypothetical protein n=1 Tax=unclassified Streptomyces TaxID=2593676 RepID=UPI00073C8CD3|nr:MULTISPECIES: hypothetical protein [unclassified Streptomyces]ODA72527.1 hypothetical protein APS67_003153 [Streptomyces sp. AVP053U2]